MLFDDLQQFLLPFLALVERQQLPSGVEFIKSEAHKLACLLWPRWYSLLLFYGLSNDSRSRHVLHSPARASTLMRIGFFALPTRRGIARSPAFCRGAGHLGPGPTPLKKRDV